MLYMKNRPLTVCILGIILMIHVCALTASDGIQLDVITNLYRLLQEEDTDGDKKITINDHYIAGEKGNKKFWLIDINGKKYEVCGTYFLSNLLQELKLMEEKGYRIASLKRDRIYESPVHRISRLIRDSYWRGLTRKISEESLPSIIKDPKVSTKDNFRYIYVPYDDSLAFNYYQDISKIHPELRLKVLFLPKLITPEWVRNLDGYHGLLSLALKCNEDGKLEAVPYVVPGGRFNEMYGWDSYFILLGLISDEKIELAKAMVDNFVYEINHYGKILNANRTYYLTRSQPPFLTSMARAVYEKLPHSPENKKWLRKVLSAAIKEYYNVWMGEKRLTRTGLSRYYGEGFGPPPEVEPGHFNVVYARYARRYSMNIKDFEEAYRNGKIKDPELFSFFKHDRAMRESGHDKTYRWDDRCADFVTVDLNSLLYRTEMDIAQTIKEVFKDSLVLESGKVEKSSTWFERAKKRRKLINKYLWDSEYGLFFDHDIVNNQRKVYISATVFYPLWAGLATKEQAELIVENATPFLEMPGGLAASSKESRGEISITRPQRQWDYPYGWAPHQIMAWIGLINYGYGEIACRLAYRWLYTITRNAVDFNGTITEKYNVVKRTHQVFVEYGNVGTKFSYITKEGFGWTNASYQIGIKLLPEDLYKKLENLIPPEWIWGY